MPSKVNPEILKWARKSAKITLDKAAKTISKTCKIERIKEWEDVAGKDVPSVKQTEKLARLYRRQVDIFYLPFIPKDFPPLKDFRKEKDEYNTALIFMMREIQEKQEWLSNYLKKQREKKLDYCGKFNIKNQPGIVAADIRKTLGINSKQNIVTPIKHWIEKAENKRIYVSLSSNYHTRLKLDSDVFKGFVIADKFAPFIFINSDDWDHGQLFTLVHELAHIWIGVTGVSNDTGIVNAPTQGMHLVEKFCNEVATLALLPPEEVEFFIPTKGDLVYKNISKAGRKLGVSTQAILQRLLKLDLIDSGKYNQLKKEADDGWKEFLYKESIKKKSAGGPNYYIMQLRRSSKAYSNIIMNIYKGGKINGVDASRLLKVKEGNFQKFEKYIYK